MKSELNEGLKMSVQILKQDEGGAFNGMTTFTFVLGMGNERVSCEGVLYLEGDEEELEGTFYEWLEMAAEGEPGCTAWTEAG
jgi:hypothetical protein